MSARSTSASIGPVAAPGRARRRVKWVPTPPAALASPARASTIDRVTRLWESLPPVCPAEMQGLWRGTAVTSGTVFAVLLRASGWYGKMFRSEDDVDALVFSRPASVLAAINYAMIAPWRLPEDRALTRHPLGAARLVVAELFGSQTAAMAYRFLPIVDHFRRLSEASVLGLMQIGRRETPELFFSLERADLSPSVGPGTA